MDFPKLVYDDFYKFLMSLGAVLFLVGIGLGVYIVDTPVLNAKWILPTLFSGGSILLMILVGKKWQKNQDVLDARYEFENDKIRAEKEKFEAETQLIKQSTPNIIKPEQEIKIEKTEEEIGVARRGGEDVALVSYKIASVLPNTISFNFLKDWHVWFLIENHERKKYKAYIKIKFISDNYEKELNGGYYGGAKAWSLNALTAIVAPGLDVLEEVREKAKQRKRIEIEISCEIKDENDELVEKKLPVSYVYDYENNNWYYEP